MKKDLKGLPMFSVLSCINKLNYLSDTINFVLFFLNINFAVFFFSLTIVCRDNLAHNFIDKSSYFEIEILFYFIFF